MHIFKRSMLSFMVHGYYFSIGVSQIFNVANSTNYKVEIRKMHMQLISHGSSKSVSKRAFRILFDLWLSASIVNFSGGGATMTSFLISLFG